MLTGQLIHIILG